MKYSIIYSKRRSVSIQIKRGEIFVKAPIGLKEVEIEKIVAKHESWIEKAKAREQEVLSMEENLGDKDIARLKREAVVYFGEKCREFASDMGLEYNRITITSAKGRFGSCSASKNICFSYRLMLYPPAAREYVIVHELAHLKEMNHSKRFYKIIENYMPDYKERIALLKHR